MQKELEQTKVKYEDLVNKVSKVRNNIKGFSYITTNSIYEEKINDLFLATKYMTQITTLRLNTLLKYIQELQAVRLTIANLNALNTAQKNNLTFSMAL